MEWLAVLIYATVFLGLSYKMGNSTSRDKSLFWGFLLLLKIGLAIAYGYIHRDWYGYADTMWVYEISNELATVLKQDPITYLRFLLHPGMGDIPEWANAYHLATGYWYNPHFFFISKLFSVISLAANGNYNVMATLTAGITFLFTFYLFKNKITGHTIWAYLIIAVLLPYLFFTSSIHKESIVFIGIISTIIGTNKRKFIWLIIGFLFLLGSRAWTGLALLPVVITLFKWFPSISIKRTILYTISIWSILLAIGHLIGWIDIGEKIHLYQSYYATHQGTTSYSLNYTNTLMANAWVTIVRVWAILTGIIPISASSWIHAVIIAEALTSSFLLATVFWISWRNKDNISIQYCTIYIFCILVIAITIPNLGAAMRYKSPFLILLVLGLLRKQKSGIPLIASIKSMFLSS